MAYARKGLFNPLKVCIRDAVRDDSRIAGRVRIVRRFDAAKDDVLASEQLDLFLRLVTGPLADGEHGDDATCAEEDAQGGEHAAEFVQHQAVNTCTDRPQERAANHALSPTRLCWRMSSMRPSFIRRTWLARSAT